MIQGDHAIAKRHAVRQRISKQFDHDPRKLVEYDMQRQEQHKERLLDLAKSGETDEAPLLT